MKRIAGLAVWIALAPQAACGPSPEPIAASRAAVSKLMEWPATKLQLQTQTGSCGGNQAQQFFRVTNQGTADVKVSDIAIKFWIYDTTGATVLPNVWTGGCLVGPSGCFHQVSGVTATATSFSPSCGPSPTAQANWEITVTNTDSTPLGPGMSWSNLQAAFHLSNWSNFNPGATSWYSPCLRGTSYASDTHFGLYLGGKLVYSSGVSAPSCRAPKGDQPLSGYLKPEMVSRPYIGPVPTDLPIQVAVTLPVNNPTALANLVAKVADPTNASYRQYLTPTQFTNQFAPSATSYQAVVDWATARGLTVTTSVPGRLMVDVVGTVDKIQQAFAANLIYRQRTDGTPFFMLDREPSVDLTVPLLRVSGLDNFVLPKPSLTRSAPPFSMASAPAAAKTSTLGSGPYGTYTAGDLRAAYVPCTSLTGTAQSIGLFALDGFNPSDIATYQSFNNIVPPVPVSAVLINDYPGTYGPGNEEVALDIEMAIAMAPGLARVYVFEGSVANSILYAMANFTPLSMQLASSWSFTTDSATQQILNQFAVQGQSFYQASGDSGAYSSDPLDNRDAATQTLVGGTVLTMNAAGSAYQSETGWSSSGGGILTSVPIPPYQLGLTGPGVSTTRRNVPDVAMVASNVLEVYTDPVLGPGTGVAQGGTSVATPLWAGFTALANQHNQSAGRLPIGFMNPVLYSIARNPALYPSNFHDTTTGNNGHSTAAGYDLVTGWGSPSCSLLAQLETPLSCYTENWNLYPVNTLLSNVSGWTVDGGPGQPYVVSDNLWGIKALDLPAPAGYSVDYTGRTFGRTLDIKARFRVTHYSTLKFAWMSPDSTTGYAATVADNPGIFPPQFLTVTKYGGVPVPAQSFDLTTLLTGTDDRIDVTINAQGMLVSINGVFIGALNDTEFTSGHLQLGSTSFGGIYVGAIQVNSDACAVGP
jgi:hypothetical protein